MTYKSDKLNLQSQSIAGVRHWSYTDTGYLLTTTSVAGYFTDAKAKGVEVGDIIHCSNTTSADRFVFLEVQDTGATSGSVGDTG
jgi:hypothetical protein